MKTIKVLFTIAATIAAICLVGPGVEFAKDVYESFIGIIPVVLLFAYMFIMLYAAYSAVKEITKNN